MRCKRLLILFGAFGFLIPVIFTVSFAALDASGLYGSQIAVPFIYLQLAFWPTSFLLLAADGIPNWTFASLLWTFCVALTNIPLYLLAGLIYWAIFERKFGPKRS